MKKIIGLLAAAPVLASAATHLASVDVADLSLEQLTQLRVTSLSRRAEALSGVPASVFVITREDIRRSGVTSLPEALRLAPNLHVGRGDSHEYTVVARGGSTGTSNKMLVLIDGRTVYSPLFSGVFWDTQGVALEDVDRIEVVSGPAGTIWGTNSVNGFINVITLPASQTAGTLATVRAGNEERLATLRHGGRLGPGSFRLWARHLDRDGHLTARGTPAPDGGDRRMGGLRYDGPLHGGELAVLAEIFSGSHNHPTGRRDVSGRHLLARWSSGGGPAPAYRVQAYIDDSDREHRGRFGEQRQIADLEYTGSRRLGGNHDLVYGAGYRQSSDRIANMPALAFFPDRRTLRWANLFVQDDIALGEELRAVVGARLEHNSYTGMEFLPNVRLAWQPAPQHLAWAALSRAVRAPSRIDRDLFLPGVPPHTILAGGPGFESEIADVLEVGYRGQLSADLSLSATAFRHRFDRLRSYELVDGRPAWSNGNEGTTTGFEAWATWRLAPSLRLTLGGFAMDQDFRTKPGRRDLAGLAQLGNDPNLSVRANLQWDPSPVHEVDIELRHEGRLPDPVVPKYTVADIRLGWAISPQVRTWLRVENVTDRRHAEFGDPATRAVFGRTWLLGLSWAL